jgi:phenylalanyl-tRNA synthetase beta chain
MGGRDSEVTDATSDVFIEVANFNPARVRAARRALGMSTDASYRFERSVDVELAPRALERVTKLVILLAGGAVDGAPVDLAYSRAPSTSIILRTRRVERVLGDPVGADEIGMLLGSVGFDVSRSGDDTRVAVPSWRGDVTMEVDLIEEVARLRGYESFTTEIRPFRPGTVPDDPQWLTSKRVRETLVAAGLLETRPMPFVSGGEGFVRLSNPLSETEAHLRREILDTLARRAEYNLARMQRHIRLFEIGSVFTPRANALPLEELRVGALLMGRRQPPHFTDPKSAEFEAWARYDEWDAKGLARGVAEAAYPGAVISVEPSGDGVDLWTLKVDDRAVGVVRRVALDAPVWADPAFGIELSLALMESAPVAGPGEHAYVSTAATPSSAVKYKSLPATPASEFDLALLVPDRVTAEQVSASMRRVAGRLLERVELFDRYVGEGVESGYRSLAWRLTFRHAERTLRDREIEARRSEILKALADELNVRQRSG